MVINASLYLNSERLQLQKQYVGRAQPQNIYMKVVYL